MWRMPPPTHCGKEIALYGPSSLHVKAGLVLGKPAPRLRPNGQWRTCGRLLCPPQNSQLTWVSAAPVLDIQSYYRYSNSLSPDVFQVSRGIALQPPHSGQNQPRKGGGGHREVKGGISAQAAPRISMYFHILGAL